MQTPSGLALGVVGLLVLAGCTSAGGAPEAPSPSAVPSDLPAAVVAALHAELRQDRTQYADRTASLRVVNDSGADLVLLGGTVTAPGYASTTPEGETDRPLPAGAGRDVRLRLGDVDCATVPDDAGVRAVVRVAAAPDDGTTDDPPEATEVEVPVTDPLGRLAAVHAEVCAQRLVATGASLEVAGVEASGVAGRDGEPEAGLRITVDVTPVDGGPEVDLVQVSGTTLLSPAGGEPLWTGAAVRPQDGRVVLDALPARCDAHAVGEDKRGTFLPVTTTVDGVEQPVVYLPMTDAQRAAVFDAIHDACGWD